MKIFIIYASAGFGHKKIAEAINETAANLSDKNSVSFIDILDFTPSLFKFLYSKGYVFLISRMKWLWAILFFLSDTKYLKLLNNNFLRFSNRISCYRFLNFIKNQQPDVIISTHFLVNELVSFLKEKGQIKSKLISIVTDFGVHNLWVAKNVDIYSVASKQTKEILISRQVDREKIRVLGMPVRNQFQKQIDKELVKQKLGLNQGGFTVLILTGGIGIGPIYQIVKLLEDKVNIIVVCGTNRKLFSQLNNLKYKNLIILGWIEYIQEVMAVSDIVVTKPGGSTIAECLVMGLPMIFFSIIPGQESQNAKIISKNELAPILKKPHEIKEKIFYYKNNLNELNKIKRKIQNFSFKKSSENILEIINE